MDLITWSKKLSVGIKSIDMQHKTIINMINTLNDALIEDKSHDVILKIFEALSVYTKTHFEYEEKLFERYNYVQRQAHKNEHVALKTKVEDLENKIKGGDFMVAIELMQFLEGWVDHHILETDMQYSKFLISQGVK